MFNFKKDGGFSLVEMLLVVLVVGFIVLVITRLPASISLIGNSHHQSVAKDIANQQIENVRIKSYASLANGSTPVVDSRLSSLPNGSGSVVLADCPTAICQNGEQIKQLTVTIQWMDSQTARNLNFVTLIANGGLK